MINLRLRPDFPLTRSFQYCIIRACTSCLLIRTKRYSFFFVDFSDLLIWPLEKYVGIKKVLVALSTFSDGRTDLGYVRNGIGVILEIEDVKSRVRMGLREL